MDLTWIGFLAGFLTTIGFIPQAIKSYRTKHMEDVSFFQPLILLTGMSLWIVYGFTLNDPAIIIANAVALALNLALIILKIKYSTRTL
jgi:MtN3 and saliva related transmembrane protein